MNDDIFIPDADSVMRYQAQLATLLKSSGSRTETIDMGRLPEIYTILGIADKQLKTNDKTILKALGLEGRNKHNVPLKTVESLLSLTYDPEAVFKSLPVSNNPGAYIAVLNAKTENQEQIIAILSPSRDGHGFTFIPSVYEKHNFDRLLGRIYEEQKILYVKSKGSEIWGQLQSLPRHNSEPSIKNILTKNDIVKHIFNKEQNMTKEWEEKSDKEQKQLFDEWIKGRANDHRYPVNLGNDRYKIRFSDNSEGIFSQEQIDEFYKKNKLNQVNQLINEKAEVQKDGSLRISSEDWRGINRELNKGNIGKNKLFEDAIRNIANETPPLERRNINSKENFMSDVNEKEEKTFRPSLDAGEKVAKEQAFINMKHQRKMVLDGIKNGTLSCLPGEDGFADVKPAINLINGTLYHGTNMLDLKAHQKQNGFPTAEYITENQFDSAKKDCPGLSIRQGEKGLSIHWESHNDQTGEWEKKSAYLFNVAQTTDPEQLKAYAEQKQQEERQKYIDNKKAAYPEWEPKEPKQRTPGPVIECSGTDPEKYLGQYFAAVSMGGKFKVSEEQAAEFASKMENSLSVLAENGYPDLRTLPKISNAASTYCKDVIKELRMVEQKEQYKEQQQQQTQSRGRSR